MQLQQPNVTCLYSAAPKGSRDLKIVARLSCLRAQLLENSPLPQLHALGYSARSQDMDDVRYMGVSQNQGPYTPTQN